eukprot:Tamp_07351.p1 GENE.Tamp_07351~~Tamp_07351.p1  ORF type:complete len:414 (+),score=52.93 Tamp_07351:56-1243(+)
MCVGYGAVRARNMFDCTPAPLAALVNVQLARGLGAGRQSRELNTADLRTMTRRFSSPADGKAGNTAPDGARAPHGGGSQGNGGGASGLSAALGLPVGGIAGTFGSLVGVGGGVIMVPMLTCRPLSLHAREASATSLVAVVGTGLISAILYTSYGQSNLEAAGIIAAAAMVTAPAGARATMALSHTTLKRLMGLFLLLAAPSVPLRDCLKTPADCPSDPAPPTPAATSASSAPAAAAPGVHASEQASPQAGPQAGPQNCNNSNNNSSAARALPPLPPYLYVPLLLVTGGSAGFLSGLLGIGGGIIVTPLLSLFSGMPQHHVVGTSMVAMIAPSAVSLYTHHTLGNVHWPVGRMLFLGSAAGAALGVSIAQGVDDGSMKRIFGVAMFALGLKTLKSA